MLPSYYMTLRFAITLFATLSNLLTCGWSYGNEGCRGSTLKRSDPSSCHQYFQCISGVSYRARCGPGTVFSRMSQKCENSARIPCSANKVTGHPLERQPCHINGEIRPSEIECDKYLLCRVNYYVGMSCPFGLIFSNIKYRCVTPPDPCVTAGGHGTLKELELKKEENPYIGVCDQKINQTVAEPFDCSMYILCEEDRSDETQVQAAMSILECPNKTLFSDTQNKCLAPSAVYCGSRFRVVNLYGPDIRPPAGLGRSIGGGNNDTNIRASGRNPEKPKYWIQPGKYRAIAGKPHSNETLKTGQSKTNRSNSSSGGGVAEIITTSVNGFIIQKPLKVERPTPIELTTESGSDSRHAGTTEEDDDDDSVTETSTTGSRDGRSFRRPVSEGLKHDRSGGRNGPNATKDTTTKTRTRPTTAGNADETNSMKRSHVERKDVISHHDRHQIVVNIIMGNGPHVPPIVTRGHDVVRHKSSKENQLEPQVEIKGRNQSGTKPKEEWVEAEYGSLESDEDEPFRFNRSWPRAPKRTTILEDYHAVLNGKRFNSTAEDILYYGEDEYYVGDSNETGVILPRNASRFEDSLELTHHTSGSPASPKVKLPERPPPLEK